MSNLYVPSSQVVSVHSFPRYSSSTSVESNSFPQAIASQSFAEYLTGTLPIPLLILVIGIVLAIALQITLCLRYCFPGARCLQGSGYKSENGVVIDIAHIAGPNEARAEDDALSEDYKSSDDQQDEVDTTTAKIIDEPPPWKRNMTISSCFLLLIMVVLLIGGFIADASILESLDALILSVLQLRTTIQSLNSIVKDIILELSSLSDVAKSSSCSFFPSAQSKLESAVGQLQDGALSLQDSILDIPDRLQQFAVNVSYFQYYFRIIAATFLSLDLFIALLLLAAILLNAYYISKVLLILSEVLFFINMLVACSMIVLQVVVADFCIDPAQSFLSFFDQDSNTYKAISYFIVSCPRGLPPATGSAAAYLANIQKTISTAKDAIEKLGLGLSSCGAGITSSVDQVSQSTDEALAEIKCEAIYSLWVTGIETAVCRSGFDSLLALWTLLLAIAVVSYAIHWLVAILYQVFNVGGGLDDQQKISNSPARSQREELSQDIPTEEFNNALRTVTVRPIVNNEDIELMPYNNSS